MIKQNSSKVLAGILVLVMLVSMIPTNIFSIAFAEEIEEYTVNLTDGTSVLDLDDVAVTLSNKADSTKYSTVNTVDGVAKFDKFVEEEATYILTVASVSGYNDVASTEITIAAGETSYNVAMSAVEVVTVSGVVADENGNSYEGATVKVTGYENVEVVTDATGKYSYQTYKGKEVDIEITAKDDKYSLIKGQATYNSDASDVNYQLEVKKFDIITNDTVENGTITASETGVLYGSSKDIEIVANEGYRIKEVIKNGEKVDEATNQKAYTITLSDIKTSYDISVSFYKATYTVSFDVKENGEVKYNTSDVAIGGTVTNVIVEENGSVDFEAIANSSNGYHVEKVVIGNNTVLADGDNTNVNYTGTVTSNEINVVVNVAVEFAINEYKVLMGATDHGKASLSTFNGSSTTEVLVKHGESVFVQAEPVSGYELSEIKVGDAVVEFDETINVYETYGTTITSDTIVSVAFVAKEELTDGSYEISLPAASNTVNGVTYVADGASVSFTPTGDYKRVRINGDLMYSGPNVEIAVGEDSSVKTINSIEVSNKNNGGWSKEKVLNITYDGTEPIISDIENSGKWFSEATTYSFTVSDEASGIKEVKYAATKNIDEATTIEPIEGKYCFEVAEKFNGYYYIWVVDYCGNILETTADVKIDLTNPTITNYVFSTEENSVAKELINFLSFGILCDRDIFVTVTATDEEISSGLKEITLYCGEEEYGTKSINGSTAIFKLEKEKFGDGKAISAVVTDVSGRTSEKTSPSDLDISNDIIQITDGSTDVVIDINKDYENYYFEGDEDSENGKHWFNGDTDFNVNISDDVAGIKKVAVKLNDKEIVADSNEKAIDKDFSELRTDSESFVINTSKNSKDGKNVLEVNFENNVGKSDGDTKEVYIDKTLPIITKFEITDENDQPLDKVLNFLTFGIFFNKQVKITVSAEDHNASSGVRDITLYLDEDQNGFSQEDVYKIQAVQEDPDEPGKYKATFTVPEEELLENSLFISDIGAKATDYVNHSTEEVVIPTTENSDVIKHNSLMIETIPPTVNVDFADADAVTQDGKAWYAGDVEFKVVAEDINSGIRNVVITINDEELVNENYSDENKGTYSETYYVNTSDADIAQDGSYTINVSITDNAGNVYNEDPKTIYKDIDKPYITGFDFKPANFVEGSETYTTVEVTEYGFYFKEDTEITISAADDSPTSGIKSITYYTVDYTNEENGIKSEEKTELVDAEGKINILIPADFKGQIYAKATDNVINVTDEFVNPNSAIIESEEKHSEENHIDIKKAKTTFTTNDNTELYAEDVDVTITVTDTYSGIREIEWSVKAPYDTENNQSGKVTLNNDKSIVEGTETDWIQTKSEANLVTEMQKTITVNNNSNNIIVDVKMTDRAGNTSSDSIEFSIDKVNPEIVITYDENEIHDEEYTDFFSTKRKATITITERNFRSSDVDFAFTNTEDTIPNIDLRASDTWTTIENSENPDATTHVATFEYTVDGDYTFDISYKDNVDRDANNIEQHKFTIDMTKPFVSVVYNNNSALNGNYYKAERTATITINEHNFDANRVNVVGVATDNGATATFPTESAWVDNGNDTYTATIVYAADSKYTFDIEFNDKANNSIDDYTPEEFYVDKTAPNLEILGVADKSANNGDVIPVITYSDTNFNKDAVIISLIGAHNGSVNYAGSYSDIANGQTYTYANFEKVKDVDDIYTLTAKLTDMAGNETEMAITFSANRFGSIYDITNVEDINNKYLQVEKDIVFTETNVDTLDREGIIIKLTKNGTPSNLVEGTDYTVDITGGNGQWSVYKYTINKSLFTDDGRYSISIYSIDAAGNVNENIDETKAAEISFGIDKTNPVVVPIDLESGKQYPVEGKTVSIEIKDNLVLEDVKIYLNGEDVEYTVEGESYTFFIPESNDVQTVKVMAIDSAGNESELIVEDFLVSTNIFVRWYNNTPIFVGSIIGFVVLALGVTIFILFGKKKENNE